MFRLLALGQVAKSENVYSYKYIVDCMEQNQLLDISEYRSVSVVVLWDTCCNIWCHGNISCLIY